MQDWDITASKMSLRTENPIRQIVDSMRSGNANSSKKFLSLSIGDPTVFGNLPRAVEITEAVVKSTQSFKYEGYPPATGYEFARKAVADYFNEQMLKFQDSEKQSIKLSPDDVMLTSGCSHALEIAMSALCDAGDNILISRPCFPLYKTIAQSFGFEARYYNLDPNRSWEIDLQDAERQVDKRTKAILVNNPSNPCGSVYSKEHLIQIIAFAEKHRIPIIADEIYWDMAFSGSKFYPLASLTQTVPIISLGALSKRWLVPGWRMGWLLIFDPAKKLHEVRKGMIMLAQRLCGPNAIVQGALSDIFSNVPEAFYSSLNSQLESLAHLCINSLKGIHGLHPLPPQGTMYIMVEIKISEFSDIKDDMDFCQKLLAEENVLLLPGRAFGLNNFFRIVFCGPEDILKQSAQRISEFCVRHAR